MRPARAAIPGSSPPEGLPIFVEDGSILPPARSDRDGGRPIRPPRRRAAGLDWMLMLAALALVALGTLLVWSATSPATT